MKHPILAALVVSAFALSQCGDDSVDTARLQEQAKRDSLERVQAERQAALATEAAPVVEPPEPIAPFDLTTVGYDSTGRFAVQVGSWRSRAKADSLVSVWSGRGFDRAFVEEYGNRETGDVWFRVRLGRMDARTQADGLAQHVRNRYKDTSWVASY